jgi:cobalt-precorrin 5A hydrolase
MFSVGAAVRLLAPLLQDKKTDPAVVAIDDIGRFAISLLSGHLGGANDWTTLFASILGATPVITTASDLLGTLSVDLLGRDLGWKLDPVSMPQLTDVAGLVVDHRPVALVYLAGESEFWSQEQPLPEGITYHTSYDMSARACEAALVVSDRVDPFRCAEGESITPNHPIILYRPLTLAVGVGCDRGFPAEVMVRQVAAVLAENNLAAASVRLVASIDLKRDEPCIMELARHFAVPFCTFRADELETVSGVEHPSTRVKNFVGTPSVAEASALGAATGSKLLVPKLILRDGASGKNMTVAVSQTSHQIRNEVQGEVES